MSKDRVVVSSQRTMEDVATELTITFMETHSVSPERAAEIYKLFYKNAVEAYNAEY
ncbi:hypothetical protein [Paraclostridium bifermentans]|uniref:hypothetical protein n=1 Tax=Paraclostridium bifermentans TaxID=1490 RepID=UPI0018AB6F15|nr:hypothetical protein [Paraclostridium bifermentans]